MLNIRQIYDHAVCMFVREQRWFEFDGAQLFGSEVCFKCKSCARCIRACCDCALDVDYRTIARRNDWIEKDFNDMQIRMHRKLTDRVWTMLQDMNEQTHTCTMVDSPMHLHCAVPNMKYGKLLGMIERPEHECVFLQNKELSADDARRLRHDIAETHDLLFYGPREWRDGVLKSMCRSKRIVALFSRSRRVASFANVEVCRSHSDCLFLYAWITSNESVLLMATVSSHGPFVPALVMHMHDVPIASAPRVIDHQLNILIDRYGINTIVFCSKDAFSLCNATNTRMFICISVLYKMIYDAHKIENEDKHELYQYIINWKLTPQSATLGHIAGTSDIDSFFGWNLRSASPLVQRCMFSLLHEFRKHNTHACSFSTLDVCDNPLNFDTIHRIRINVSSIPSPFCLPVIAKLF
jgi:hypothetical protein